MPALDPERVVSLGQLSKAAVRTICRASHEVVVCVRRGPGVDLDDARIRTRQVAPGAALPLPDESVDVLVVTDRGWLRGISREARLAAEVARVLRPDGTLYVEWNRLSAADAHRALARLQRERLELWLAPGAGEMRAAVPADASDVIGWNRRRWLRPLPPRRALRRPALAIARHPVLASVARRQAALARREAPLGIPAYLAAAAREAEASVDECRWSLVAPGDYNSQKVLVFLFDPGEDRPRAVVKMTRDPSFNDRLENEWRALTTLASLPVGSKLPRPLFRGTHAGLTIVGETAIEGLPLRRVVRDEPASPYAERGLRWLVELAASTASPRASDEVGTALGTLLELFFATYTVTTEERSFLVDQLATVERLGDSVPTVFQHGDPGAWNALVASDGDLAFLDWEAAEHAGVPFWDLFYFARSMAVVGSRAAGPPLGTDPARRVFLEESELGRQLERAVRALAERTGIPLALVEPLFYLCWVHRALKEATRRRPDELDRGVYIRLLRLCIERRAAPGLESLFTVAAGGRRSCES
jgi:hypothetical protein